MEPDPEAHAPGATRFSPAHQRYFLAMIGLAMMMNTVDRYVMAILVDDIKRDLGLDDRQLGLLLGPSFAIVYGLAVLPLARLSDRGVRRTIIAVGLFFWSLFTAAAGLAQSFLQLFALRMGVGVGEAAASPAAQSMISDIFPPERRARGLSVISIGSVLGLAVGMAGGGWLAELYGWRVVLVAFGLPGIALALVFRFSIREPRRGASDGLEEEGEGPPLLEGLRRLLSHRSFRWLLVAHALALFFSMGKNAWEPTFIRRVYDMGPGAAGTWYFLTTPLPSAIGVFLGGWLSDRWGRRDARARMWVPAIGCTASVPFLYAFLVWSPEHRLVLSESLPPLPVAFLPSIVASVLGAMYTAPMLSSVQELARVRMRASAAAVFSLSGSAVGTALGPFFVGDLAERFAADHGDFAVRQALVWLLASFLLCALTCLAAARSYRTDLARVRD